MSVKPRQAHRYYVVIYEGIDPVTGKEKRSWHPAGSDRAEAERLAKRLGADKTRRYDTTRSLTFGAYLTGLPRGEVTSDLWCRMVLQREDVHHAQAVSQGVP